MTSRTSRTWLGLLTALLLAAPACTTPPSHIGADPVGGDDTSTLAPEARAELDEALALLGTGDPATARERLLLLASRYPDSDTADIADTFAAFAGLQAEPGDRDALQRLQAAAGDDDHPHLQLLAVELLAVHHANTGDPAAARRLLAERHAERGPSSLLPRGLARRVLPNLAEARAQDDAPAALAALSWLFQLGDDDDRAFARARALHLARTRLDQEQLDRLADDPDDFVAGTAAAAALLRALDQDLTTLAPDQRQRLADRAERANTLLTRIDAPDLAAELVRRLEAASGPSNLVIGALLPLSGADRRVGRSALNGMALAQSTFRTDATPRLTLLIADTGSTAEGARAGAERLIKEGAALLIGPLSNDEARAATRAASGHTVPIITLNLDPTTANPTKHTFRFFVDSQRELDALFQHAHTAQRRKLAVLYPDLPFGKDLLRVAQAAAPRHDLEIVAALSYDPASSDFSKEAQKVAASDADALLIPDVAARVSLILPFLAAEKLPCAPASRPSTPAARNLACLGNVTWFDDALLRDGGSFLSGAVIAASWSPLADTPDNDRFQREHRAMIGGDPDVFAAFAYDAVRFARRALLQRGLTSRETLADGLRTLPPGEGLTGAVQLLPSGDIAMPPVLLQIQGDRFTLLNASPPAP